MIMHDYASFADLGGIHIHLPPTRPWFRNVPYTHVFFVSPRGGGSEISGAGPGVRKQDLPSSEQLLDCLLAGCGLKLKRTTGVHSFVGLASLDES